MGSGESSHKGMDCNTEIAKSVIKSPEYGRRISTLGENSKVQQKIIDESRKALYHRNGTSYEDLIFINAINGEMRKNTTYDKEREVMPTKSMKRMIGAAVAYTIISIHNHPSSTVPSLADINSMIKHKYRYGLVVGHDGTIFKYSVMGEYNSIWYNAAFRELDRNGYSQENIQTFINRALEAGIRLEVL